VKLAQKQGEGNDRPQPSVGRAPSPAAFDVDVEFGISVLLRRKRWRKDSQDPNQRQHSGQKRN